MIAHQAASDIKFEESARRFSTISEADQIIYELRIKQELIKVKIQEEQLKRAKIETETALIRKNHEEDRVRTEIELITNV